MIWLVITLILFLIWGLIAYFLLKNNKFCNNFNSLKSLSTNPLIKYYYLPLTKSNISTLTKRMLKNKNNKIFPLKHIYKNKDYLMTISKFVDYKINSNKQTFRTKNENIIVENIAYIISKTIYHNEKYKIYFNYKLANNMFSLKIKEHKVFKYLLGKFLIYELYTIYDEIYHISNIIQKYKKRKINIIYKKNIYNIAKFYSIFKYNNNSTKLTFNQKINRADIVKILFEELFFAEQKIRTIIAYLKAIF